MNYITSEPYISRKTSHITKAIDTVLELFKARGFNINSVHGENEFHINTLKAKLLPIFKQIYGKEDHVGIIERIIRVTKERAGYMCHAIPYQYHTKIIIQSLISCVVKWINEFTTKGGIPKTISLSMIVEGKKILISTKRWLCLDHML